MPSKFTVLQYLPNPVSGERVNIGVIAFSEKGGHVRFLSRWNRVKAFSGGDVTFLKDLSKEVVSRVESLTEAVRDKYVEKFDTTAVESWISRWAHTIEFTQSRASTLEPAELLNDLCGRLLAEPISEPKLSRDRKAASQVAAYGLRKALQDKVQMRAETLLKKRYDLEGKRQSHTFDAAIANGVPYVAVMGVSFEGPPHSNTDTFFDSLAWAVSDCASAAQAIPIAIVALPPKSNLEGFSFQQKSFAAKKKLYSDLGASFVVEADYQDWAHTVVGGLRNL